MSPYHYRLDWLLWFAAMGAPRDYPWAVHLAWKLLEADPTTLGLLATDPFGGAPPRHVRVDRYRYRFAPRGAGVWWQRERLGHLAAARLARQRGAADAICAGRVGCAIAEASRASALLVLPACAALSAFRIITYLETLLRAGTRSICNVAPNAASHCGAIRITSAESCLPRIGPATYPEPMALEGGPGAWQGVCVAATESFTRRRHHEMETLQSAVVRNSADRPPDAPIWRMTRRLRASAAIGDRLPGLQVDEDLLDEATDAFSDDREHQRRPRADLQRTRPAASATPTAPSAAPASRSSGASAASTTASSIRSPTAAARCASCSRRQLQQPEPACAAAALSPGNPTLCYVPLEVEPAEATVRNVGRLTTPTFGLGLVDADARFVLRRPGGRATGRRSAASSTAARSPCPTRAIRPSPSARRASPASGGRPACPA